MVAFHQRCVKGSSGFLISHGQIIEKDPDLVEVVLKWCTEQVKGVKASRGVGIDGLLWTVVYFV